jgi:hypothetical protein
MTSKTGFAAFFVAMAAFAAYLLLSGRGGCKVDQPLPAAGVLADVVAIAEANTRGWSADSIVVDILQSKLRPDGSADYTRLTSYSPSKKAEMNVSFSDGKLSCATNAAEPDPRAADAPRDFLRDGAALYKMAQAQGQALLDKGYEIETRFWVPDSKWIVELHKEGAKPHAMTIDIDVKTGAFRSVKTD